MPKSKFKISPFTNPSGITAWRLSGTLNGKRIRQNFKTRPEAVAQRQEYDVEHLNGEPEGRTVWTTLTPEENRDAVAAINSLKARGSKCSLAFAVDYLLQHYRPPDLERLAGEVAQEYLNKRDRDCLKGFITELQYKTIKNEMQWFKRCFEGRLISSITADEIYTHANGNDYYRIKAGNGSLTRNTPTNGDIQYAVLDSGQWKNKTRKHEEEHVKQWSTGAWKDYFSVSVMRARMDSISDTYAPNSAGLSAVKQEVQNEISTYNNVETIRANNTSAQRESQARAAADNISPPYDFSGAN